MTKLIFKADSNSYKSFYSDAWCAPTENGYEPTSILDEDGNTINEAECEPKDELFVHCKCGTIFKVTMNEKFYPPEGYWNESLTVEEL